MDRLLMTGVIVTSRQEPWKVANWAFRMLLRRLAAASDDEADRRALWQAEIFQSLDFGDMEPPQRMRLALAVARGAEELRPELLRSDDPRDHEFATLLTALALALREEFG